MNAQSQRAGDDTFVDWAGAPGEHQSYGPAFLARTHLIDRALRKLRPQSLLDIGCGRGNVTAVAARHAKQVVATDLAQDAVAATRTLLDGYPDFHAYTADILGGDWGEYASQRGTRFDCVLLSEVLEHLDDDRAALLTCRELLTDRGCLLLTVPADPTLWTRFDELVGHRRRYTRQELTSKLEDAGFRVRELTNWGFPLTGWLHIRGARMQARRAEQRTAGGAIPPGLKRILPVASLAFRIAARLEPGFSFLDRGAGYVVVAERVPSKAESG